MIIKPQIIIKKIIVLSIIISVIISLRFYTSNNDSHNQSQDNSADIHFQSYFPNYHSHIEADSKEKMGVIFDSNNQIIGHFLKTSGFCSDIIGYAGPIEFILLFDHEKKTKEIVITEHNETPSFLKRLEKKGFFRQFTNQSMDSLNLKEFESVSGATMSSRAIIESIKKRISHLTIESSGNKKESIFSFINIINFITIGYLLFLSYAFHNPKRLQIFVTINNK